MIDTSTKKVGPDVEIPEPDNNADTAPLLALIATNKNGGDGKP